MSSTQAIASLQNNISKVIIGKQDSIKLLVVCLLSGGHVLLEDVPGLGKTILARSLSKSIAGRFRRVQCTPDLLPSDITGVSIYNEKTREFEFKPGPVFANILLVDEINRTTPRTQSSLLEAMAEGQVSADGKTYRLPKPYMVIATQNPIENHGTYPLPEAQLDRFLMKLSMGYPTLDDEVHIMQSQQSIQPLDSLRAVIKTEDIAKLQIMTTQIHIEKDVARYIAEIVHATRKHKSLSFGASPRGSLSLMRASQAMALVNGQNFVDPETIKAIAKPVLAHRIAVKPQYMNSQTAESIIDEILASIKVPMGGSQGLNSAKAAIPEKTPSSANPISKEQAKQKPATAQATAPQPEKAQTPAIETTDTGMELLDI